MSYRLAQINEAIKNELARLISRDTPLENGLITVLRVKCSADFKNATVKISVLPDGLAGTALKMVKKNNKLFSENVGRKLKLRNIPKLFFRLDTGGRYSDEIEKVIKIIKEENNE
ncbi:MAG: ribosome-binding factor A [bacterium]